MEPLIQHGMYEHYKGGRYRVVCLAKIEATHEDVVVYEALYDNDVAKYWVRPVASFLEEVEIDGARRPRFRYTGEE